MDVKELAKKVKEVRNAQKHYFKNRTPENLEFSKYLEKELDKEVESILDDQSKLFQ